MIIDPDTGEELDAAAEMVIVCSLCGGPVTSIDLCMGCGHHVCLRC